MKKLIFKVFGWNVLAAAVGMISTLVLARSLSLEEFGKLSLILSVVAIVQGIISFGFNNAVVIFLNQGAVELRQSLLLNLNFIFFTYLPAAMLGAIPLLFYASRAYAFSWLEVLTIWILIGVFSFTSYLISINQAFQQWTRYSTLNASYNLIKLLCLVTALIAAYIFLIDRYVTVTAALLTSACLYLVVVSIFNKEHLSTKKLRFLDLNYKYWAVVWPIGLTNLIIVITMRVDVLIVEHLLGNEALGIYTVAMSLAAAFPLLTNALMNVYLVHAAQVKGSRSFLQTLVGQQLKFVLPVLAVGTVTALASAYFFPIVFGQKFIPSVSVFNILLIAFLGGVLFTPLESHLYANHQRIIMIIKFLQLVSVVVFATLLVNDYGLNGVAIGIVGSRVIGWISISLIVKQELRRSP